MSAKKSEHLTYDRTMVHSLTRALERLVDDLNRMTKTDRHGHIYVFTAKRDMLRNLVVLGKRHDSGLSQVVDWGKCLRTCYRSDVEYLIPGAESDAKRRPDSHDAADTVEALRDVAARLGRIMDEFRIPRTRQPGDDPDEWEK